MSIWNVPSGFFLTDVVGDFAQDARNRTDETDKTLLQAIAQPLLIWVRDVSEYETGATPTKPAELTEPHLTARECAFDRYLAKPSGASALQGASHGKGKYV